MFQSKSNAFTMIELIFVIVLIGILASVAMTKLNATRTDAKISVLSRKVSHAIEDIKMHAVATGSLDGNITSFSNILSQMRDEGVAVLGNDGRQVTIDTGDEDDCLTLKLISDTRELNLSVILSDNTSHDTICSGVQQALGNQNHVMQIRGQLANF